MQVNKHGESTNINAQLDAHKKAQAILGKQESFRAGRVGMIVLYKGDLPRVFANMAQAQKAAERTGGVAFQSMMSNRFMVRAA